MLKKTITYTDYNGNERTEDFHFNLNKAELVEMELSKDEGLSTYIEKIVATNNNREIYDFFKKWTRNKCSLADFSDSFGDLSIDVGFGFCRTEQGGKRNRISRSRADLQKCGLDGGIDGKNTLCQKYGRGSAARIRH